MLSYIRRHLGLKLFLSYLIVILIGLMVLAFTVEMIVPTAFQSQMASMGPMMSSMMGESKQGLDQNLLTNFQAAVTEALTLAAAAAIVTAIIASILISRQVVAPVQAMMSASQRFAEGHYKERVRVAGNIPKQEQDELGQLAPIGILLSPAVGALLMSLGTVIVAASAQLLRGPELAA